MARFGEGAGGTGVMFEDQLQEMLAPMSDAELLAIARDRSWSPMKRDAARTMLKERQDKAAAAGAVVAAAEADRAERGVRAAELQATYAKRAFERANVAIGVSIAAIIVAGFFAVLDFLKG